MGRPTGPIGLTRAFVSWAGSGWPFLDPGWPIGMLDEKPIYTPRRSYRKSDVSIIYPLLATVYVPGGGGEGDKLLPGLEEDPYELLVHMQRPNYNRVYSVSPKSTKGSISTVTSFQVPSLPTLQHLDT